jgi:hypothetical protein
MALFEFRAFRPLGSSHVDGKAKISALVGAKEITLKD